MSAAKCVAECLRTRDMRVRDYVWHVVLGDGDADFQRILCGQHDGSGINLPGPRQWREPTCPACIAAQDRPRVGGLADTESALSREKAPYITHRPDWKPVNDVNRPTAPDTATGATSLEAGSAIPMDSGPGQDRPQLAHGTTSRGRSAATETTETATMFRERPRGTRLCDRCISRPAQYCASCMTDMHEQISHLHGALEMAIYHAENLRRVRDHIPVRDLDESAVGFAKAKHLLDALGDQ